MYVSPSDTSTPMHEQAFACRYSRSSVMINPHLSHVDEPSKRRRVKGAELGVYI